MPSNQDTLSRHWHTLRLLPRYPAQTTVQEIKDNLLREGFNVTVRTLQRDLQELSCVFPLVVNDQERPFGWSWQKDARSFDLPGVTISEALTLALVEQYLTKIMPVSITEQLTPHFKAAHHRLDGEPMPHRGRSWLDKVRTVQPTQPLIPPQIDPAIQNEVSHALFHEKQLEIVYRKKGETDTTSYRIHPLGMVQRGSVLYLHCRIGDYEDVRIFAIHRIEQAIALDEKSLYPAHFDMDKEIQQGTWGFGAGEVIPLKLLFTATAGEHLTETPLSTDQHIEVTEDGFLRVSATVPNTQQLHWWLLGFGNKVEVESPASLRTTIHETLIKAANLYTQANTTQNNE